jgi:hypothetical protein
LVVLCAHGIRGKGDPPRIRPGGGHERREKGAECRGNRVRAVLRHDDEIRLVFQIIGRQPAEIRKLVVCGVAQQGLETCGVRVNVTGKHSAQKRTWRRDGTSGDRKRFAY